MEDTSPITCPYCDYALTVSSKHRHMRCPNCDVHLDMEAQRAFLRGRDLYLQGREETPERPKSKKYTPYVPLPPFVLRAYQQAYSGIEYAFLGTLEDQQRKEGLEMMAEMSLIFSQQAMISEVEANYWKRLMIEQVALDELADLEDKLARAASRNLAGRLRRIHWTLRRSQLRRALRKVDKKIAEVEDILRRIEPLHARAPR